jgi:hypothetical protein
MPRMEIAMSARVGLCIAATLLLAALACPAAAGQASPSPCVIAAATTPSTDFSARRRDQQRVRHQHRRGSRVAKRPSDARALTPARPSGMSPFFPFYHGYGLDPSW